MNIQESKDLGMMVKTSESEIRKDMLSPKMNTIRPSSTRNVSLSQNLKSTTTKTVKFSTCESVENIELGDQKQRNSNFKRNQKNRRSTFKQMIETNQNEQQYFEKESKVNTQIVQIYNRTKQKMMREA